MNRLSPWRWLVGWLAALFVGITPGRAFLRFDNGHDLIYVTGTTALGYNSNIFSSRDGGGDTTYNASLDLEYKRSAGYIGVDANLGWNFGRFQKFTSENFADPSASLEFSKDTGRTTFDLLLKAARQNSSDTAANIRTQSINYGADLNWKYPDFMTQRYKLSGDFGWSEVNYQNNPALTSLASYTGSLDLIYAYSEKRDIFGGYRIRLSDTSADSRDIDHNFSLGVSGTVFSGTTGSLRVGYQIRQSDATSTTPAATYSGLSAASSLSYAVNKRLSITGQLSKDFSTTSTNISTDSLTADLNATYTFNAKFSTFADLNGGVNRFLGVLGDGRRDYDLSWGTGINWTHNDHLKASLAYDWFENWSNDSDADYIRSTITLTLTSRW